MSDIVERLRDRAYSSKFVDTLLAHAADEIERLRKRAPLGCETVQPKTNLDAAPAARASVGRPRTDKADLPTRCGTGDKPVTEPLPVFASGSGSVTPVSYEKSDEKRVLYDTKSPRNGALSGCETVPDPDSRVWETPCTPQPHATPPQGSVQGDGSFRESRNAKEPVAWAVYCDGIYDSSFCGSDAQNEAEEWRNELRFESEREWVAVPLYRQPKPALTETEAETLRELRDEAAQYADEIGLCSSEVRMRQRIIDSILERMK